MSTNEGFWVKTAKVQMKQAEEKDLTDDIGEALCFSLFHYDFNCFHPGPFKYFLTTLLA
jgi:hypothetical protein